MWQHNGRTIKEGRSWKSDDGIKHPSNWAVWSDEIKKSMGLTYVADPKTWDNRFYWGWNADETALIEKNIADVNAVDDDGKAILDDDGNQVVNLGLKSVAINNTKTFARG